MRQKLPETRRPQASCGSGIILAAIVASTFALGISQSAAQEADAAYVEAVNGRVVAFSRGKPVLLEALDTLNERTRLDVQINSEVRICHLRTQRLLILRGPHVP